MSDPSPEQPNSPISRAVVAAIESQFEQEVAAAHTASEIDDALEAYLYRLSVAAHPHKEN